ncbi:YsnF/AvaK domain-containing protein [Psychrobacter faecalis]|uniref:YsnF/AvaK domain-containing protein n=1 Tax=Psychrobacter faecalis TaxID=180588 RepID=UPI0028A67F85|nr:YsnF/AvaK domain-containing protein [Psychrobacter faecalis]
MINDDKKIDPQKTHPRSSLANAPNPTSHLEQIANHSSENKLPAPDLSATDLSNTNQQQTVSSSTQQGLANNLSTNLANHQTDTGNGGYLELLEERPVINKERLDVGKVTVTKHRRTKTIEVPIELVEEYITVRTDYQDVQSQDLLSGDYDDKDILRHVEPSLDSKAVVTINGKQVEIGDAPIEIILSRQVATITKDTHVIQEIEINKTTHTHTDSIQVALQHEELDVKEEGYLAHEQQSNAADKK